VVEGDILWVPDAERRERSHVAAFIRWLQRERGLRKILLGTPAERAANRAALANPTSLDFFVEFARTQTEYPRGS
jgi:hypothetical protein